MRTDVNFHLFTVGEPLSWSAVLWSTLVCVFAERIPLFAVRRGTIVARVGFFLRLDLTTRYGRSLANLALFDSFFLLICAKGSQTLSPAEQILASTTQPSLYMQPPNPISASPLLHFAEGFNKDEAVVERLSRSLNCLGLTTTIQEEYMGKYRNMYSLATHGAKLYSSLYISPLRAPDCYKHSVDERGPFNQPPHSTSSSLEPWTERGSNILLNRHHKKIVQKPQTRE